MPVKKSIRHSRGMPPKAKPVIDCIRQSETRYDALGAAYEFMTGRYRGKRVLTYLRLYQLLDSNPATLWEKKGFLHCTHLNILLKDLLISSGRFARKDIRKRWTLVFWFSPHQYLQVRTEKGWVDADVWAASSGLGLGSHATGFNIPLFLKSSPKNR